MARCSLDPRSPRGVMLTTAISGLVLSAGVLAQSSQRQMMVFDDGGGTQFLQITSPGARGLRLPDFVRKDLPIFYEKLHLDDVQRVVVQVLLEAYLDAFKTLSEQAMPKMHSPMVGMGMGMGMDMDSIEGPLRFLEAFDDRLYDPSGSVQFFLLGFQSDAP